MGQVIGSTDDEGVHVKDRPVGVQDLFVTFCKVLGMDPREEYITELDQPLKLVEGGESFLKSSKTLASSAGILTFHPLHSDCARFTNTCVALNLLLRS